MPVLNRVQKFAVVLATLGIVAPVPTIQAAESARTAVESKQSTVIPDVKFTKEGQFKGRVVNSAGESAKNAPVVVRQGKKEVARMESDESGVFSIAQLKPGTYQVSSGTTEGTFRVWNDKSAPPAARNYALIVLGENGARGQFGVYDGGYEPDMMGAPFFDPTVLILTAGLVATTTISAITLSEVYRLNRKVDNLTPSSP